jgi:hypothetical protein
MYAATKLKGYNENFQQLIFEKVLGHPILKGMLPLYLTNVFTTKQNHEVVENLKEGLTSNLIGQHHPNL